jgi:hypothetical protein
MEAPYNVREFQWIFIVADKIEVHCMRYEREVDGV